jgi:hypothetical protein
VERGIKEIDDETAYFEKHGKMPPPKCDSRNSISCLPNLSLRTALPLRPPTLSRPPPLPHSRNDLCMQTVTMVRKRKKTCAYHVVLMGTAPLIYMVVSSSTSSTSSTSSSSTLVNPFFLAATTPP